MGTFCALTQDSGWTPDFDVHFLRQPGKMMSTFCSSYGSLDRRLAGRMPAFQSSRPAADRAALAARTVARPELLDRPSRDGQGVGPAELDGCRLRDLPFRVEAGAVSVPCLN